MFNQPSETSATEGKLHLQAHRRRERSLHCEVCALAETGPYPAALAASFFEVQHTSPWSSAVTPRRTTLADLAVVCTNCHRAVHATADVENNMRTINRLWVK
ncbi:MAG: hypothetical protein EBS65_05320 [Betaproteobacteria bacterium]|nr:hypothetical protein [Betaproteobacteria bacterium]